MRLTVEDRARLRRDLEQANADGSPKDQSELDLLKALQDIEEIELAHSVEPVSEEQLDAALRTYMRDSMLRLNELEGIEAAAMVEACSRVISANAFNNLARAVRAFVEKIPKEVVG